MIRLRPLPIILLVLTVLALPSAAWSQPSGPPGGGPAPAGARGPIPVEPSDPSWGSQVAPVTLVHFTDLQCPFCGRVMPTLEELRKAYGPQKLRLVFKHMPLDFHKQARPAAETAVAVHQLRGKKAFWQYTEAVFEAFQGGRDHLDALREVRLRPAQVERVLKRGGPARKVDQDVALAKQIGVRGTPCSFINGVKLSGAQPLDDFKSAIDDQLVAARALRAQGVPAHRIYLELSRKNFQQAAPSPPPSKPVPATGGADSTTVWWVPITDSPALGDHRALVTIVMFADFQCPYSQRAADTLATLRQKYGSSVRIVFKHNPLPFHQRAEPAAQLATEAFARRGHPGFWEAHDKLFENSRQLEDSDLERIAGELRLSPTRTLQAVHRHKHAKRIEADQKLAKDLNASGTPTFFVNGRRLVGARPLADFERIVDEEVAHTEQLRAKGVPRHRIYATIQQGAKKTAP